MTTYKENKKKNFQFKIYLTQHDLPKIVISFTSYLLIETFKHFFFITNIRLREKQILQ